RFERALETRISSKPLGELLGNRIICGALRLHAQPGLLDCNGLADIGFYGRRLRPDVLRAAELHHATGLHLSELHQQLLWILEQSSLKEAQPKILLEAAHDDDVL